MIKYLGIFLSVCGVLAATPLTGPFPTGVQFNKTNMNLGPNGLNAVMNTLYASNFNAIVRGRELTNRFADTLNVKDQPFGAAGNGSTDDTAAIQSAVNFLTGGGTVVLPPGTYKVTSPITITNHGVYITGLGLRNSIITYDGTNTGSVIKFSKGASILFDGGIEALTMNKTSTNSATAIEIVDCSNITIRNVRVGPPGSWTDSGKTSVGLKIRGRQFINRYDCFFGADIPELIEENPNNSIDLDHSWSYFSRHDADSNPTVKWTARNVYDSGYVFYSWNLGTHGFHWVTTNTASFSQGIAFIRGRREQATGGTNSWNFYIDHSHGIHNAYFNTDLDGTISGFYLRKISRTSFDNIMYGGTGIALDATNCAVINIDSSFFQAGGSKNVPGMSIRRNEYQQNTTSPLPDTGSLYEYPGNVAYPGIVFDKILPNQIIISTNNQDYTFTGRGTGGLLLKNGTYVLEAGYEITNDFAYLKAYLTGGADRQLHLNPQGGTVRFGVRPTNTVSLNQTVQAFGSLEAMSYVDNALSGVQTTFIARNHTNGHVNIGYDQTTFSTGGGYIQPYSLAGGYRTLYLGPGGSDVNIGGSLVVTGNVSILGQTAARAAAFDGNKAVISATTTIGELNLLSGVTGGVQTNIDARARNTITITGANSVSGGGDLTASRTLALVNDSASPGNSKYYGTDAGGIKGFFNLPSGGSGYTTIQEEGSGLTARTTLNFIGGGITAVDNGGSTRTDVTVTRSGIRREIWIPATKMQTNGPASNPDFAFYASGNPANWQHKVIAFDASTDEFATFDVSFPSNWDGGAIKVKVYWIASAGTVAQGVVWRVVGYSAADNEVPLNPNSNVTSETDVIDTLQTLDRVHITSAITLTFPEAVVADEFQSFRIGRNQSHISDTKTGDALLLGVKIQYTESATEPSTW